MFSKTIFKQTLKSNYKLWIIFAVIMCVMSSMMIAVFNPQTMSGMLDMLKDTPIGEMSGNVLGGMTSILGILGNSFYGMVGVILPLIYIIITANSLVASQVDKGSMAYTLSTPIKRSKVVATQALYMITSITVMVLLLVVVGLSLMQICHGGVISPAYTDDVIAVAESIDMQRETVESDLNLILDDDDAIKVGAKSRDIDTDVYTAYLNLKMTQQAYRAAADILDVDVDDVSGDLSLITGNEDALSAAAEVMSIDTEEYRSILEMAIAAQRVSTEQTQEMQKKIAIGLTAAADVLDIEVVDLSADMGLLKSNASAMDAAVLASGIPEETLTAIITQQLATSELTLDEGVDFNIYDYLMLNLGLLLFLFATSSISFASSCIFNLSKYSLTFGAGIPIAFFIFKIMSQTGSDLEFFKYISLNTLFDPSAITGGGSYAIQIIVLAAIGIILYFAGITWFKKKDLPL